MAKNKKNKKPMDRWKLFSKIGVAMFAGGFLFGQPLVAGAGAVIWGGVAIRDGYHLIMRKKK